MRFLGFPGLFSFCFLGPRFFFLTMRGLSKLRSSSSSSSAGGTGWEAQGRERERKGFTPLLCCFWPATVTGSQAGQRDYLLPCLPSPSPVLLSLPANLSAVLQGPRYRKLKHQPASPVVSLIQKGWIVSHCFFYSSSVSHQSEEPPSVPILPGWSEAADCNSLKELPQWPWLVLLEKPLEAGEGRAAGGGFRAYWHKKLEAHMATPARQRAS